MDIRTLATTMSTIRKGMYSRVQSEGNTQLNPARMPE